MRITAAYDPRWNEYRLAIRELLKDKHSATWNNLKSVLDLEKRPYTQNGHYLQVTKDKYLSRYKAARAEAAATSEGQPPPKRQKRAVPSTSALEGLSVAPDHSALVGLTSTDLEVAQMPKSAPASGLAAKPDVVSLQGHLLVSLSD